MERAIEAAPDRVSKGDQGRTSGPRIADFRQLLGESAWHRLPTAVRARFMFRSHATPAIYRGAMHVEATWFARVLAHLWRLIGTPVAPFVGRGVPVIVRVYDLPDQTGTVWERSYQFPGRAPSLVRSIKQLDEDGTLIETLGAGLHMRLQIHEFDGALHFISEGYFFRIGPLRFNIPAWFPPGMTCVAHEDKGSGRFRFAMRTTHPWFGEMFVQDGEFE